MNGKKLVFVCVFFVMFFVFSYSAEASYDDIVTLTVGEMGGTWIEVDSDSNKMDVLELEGSVRGVPYYEDWTKFSFTCTESVGFCDDMLDSRRKYIREIQLTPDVNKTRFYVNIVGYKLSPLGFTNITIDKYSVVNESRPVETINIGLVVNSSPGSFEPSELAGIEIYYLPIMLFFSLLFFYRKLA